MAPSVTLMIDKADSSKAGCSAALTEMNLNANLIPQTAAKSGPICTLCKLATNILSKQFLNMDPFEIVRATELKQRHKDMSLAKLCRTLLSSYPNMNIDNALETIKKLRNASKEEHKIDFDQYLKTLALKKKSTVSITRLNKEVLQLWTKTHWSNINPYSDLDDILSSDDESQKMTEKVQHDDEEIKSVECISGVYFDSISGHVLRKHKRSYSNE